MIKNMSSYNLIKMMFELCARFILMILAIQFLGKNIIRSQAILFAIMIMFWVVIPFWDWVFNLKVKK